MTDHTNDPGHLAEQLATNAAKAPEDFAALIEKFDLLGASNELDGLLKGVHDAAKSPTALHLGHALVAFVGEFGAKPGAQD